MKKIRVGIDINEILRHIWVKFDKAYVEEYGEEGVPDEQYVYDFFNKYKWEDSEETTNYLKDNLPEDISPIEYVVDPKTGEAPVDAFAFTKETTLVTAKEKYNRFLFQDYLFEIFGASPRMYPQVDVDLGKLVAKYQDNVEFCIVSKENYFSIAPTLFFLSKLSPKIKNYHFVDDVKDMWKHVDVLLTTDPKILDGKKPFFKKIVKLLRPYNVESGKKYFTITHINDLIINEEKVKYFKRRII